jgi:undecaprenyl-diphosphatase
MSRHHRRDMTYTRARDHGGDDAVPARATRVAATPLARRRLGRRVLLGGVAATTLAGGLVLLTAEVVSNVGWVSELDHSVADRLHAYVLARPSLASALGVVSTVTHPNVMRLASAALAAWLWWSGRRRVAVWLAVTMAVGGGLDPLLKDLVARARPSFADPVALAPGYAFPSGHALNSLLFAACVVVLTHSATRGRRLLRATVWTAALALVLFTGFDRVGLGVHYVSDVIAGWFVALGTLLATTAAFEGWRRDEGLPPSSTEHGLDPTDQGRGPERKTP